MLPELKMRIREVRQGPDGLVYLLASHPAKPGAETIRGGRIAPGQPPVEEDDETRAGCSQKATSINHPSTLATASHATHTQAWGASSCGSMPLNASCIHRSVGESGGSVVRIADDGALSRAR
jgi:hypothetical protein